MLTQFAQPGLGLFISLFTGSGLFDDLLSLLRLVDKNLLLADHLIAVADPLLESIDLFFKLLETLFPLIHSKQKRFQLLELLLQRSQFCLSQPKVLLCRLVFLLLRRKLGNLVLEGADRAFESIHLRLDGVGELQRLLVGLAPGVDAENLVEPVAPLARLTDDEWTEEVVLERPDHQLELL